MAKFIGETKSVDNNNLSELDNFTPLNGITTQTRTRGENEYKTTSVYDDGTLTVKISINGLLKYTLEADIEPKKLISVFDGDGWEQKFFRDDDKVKGSTDSDTLHGFNGGDDIAGNAGNDTIYGGDGSDSLRGLGGNDSIFGGAARDLLNGGAGVNTLTGNGGKDTFAFDAALNGSNYSNITDFRHSYDTIELNKSNFGGIGPKGVLGYGKFFLTNNYTGKANSVVYDKSSGNLYYAKDGGSLANAQLFAKITNLAPLDHNDFVVA